MAIDYGGRKSKEEPADLDELLELLEHKVDRLKVLYEQYFMGIEKMEPQTARKEVERKMLEFTQMNIRNTALRYRFNALNQKWGVYRTYWNRTLREIEKGTYVRNLSKVSREALRKGEDIPEEVLRAMPERMRDRVLKERLLVAERVARAAARRGIALPETASPAGRTAPRDTQPDAPLEDATRPSVTPAPPPGGEDDLDSIFDSLIAKTPRPAPPPPAATPPPPAAPRPPPAPLLRPRAVPTLPPGMDDAQVQELYKRYIQAKRLVGEDARNIKVENLVATLAAQAPKIMSQYGARAVEFSVVVKDNKVILKATPKK